MLVEVTTAVIKNTHTATIDLNENRPRPQTPWPLVQPLPRRVPAPTNKPPKITNGNDTPVEIFAAPGKN